jgi:hypothetical protein
MKPSLQKSIAFLILGLLWATSCLEPQEDIKHSSQKNHHANQVNRFPKLDDLKMSMFRTNFDKARANDSYLTQTSIGYFDKIRQKSVFENYQLKVDSATQQNYMLAQQQYENKQNYGIATTGNQQDYLNQMNGFRNQIWNSVQRQFIDQSTKKVEQNNSDLQSINKSVAQVGSTQMQSSASPTSDGFQFKMGTQTNVWGKSSRAFINTSLINVEANAKFRDSELYRVVASNDLVISRDLPKIHSNFTYGGTTGNISASVNSQIINHLQCSFQANFPKDSVADHSIGLNYQIGF